MRTFGTFGESASAMRSTWAHKLAPSEGPDENVRIRQELAQQLGVAVMRSVARRLLGFLEQAALVLEDTGGAAGEEPEGVRGGADGDGPGGAR